MCRPRKWNDLYGDLQKSEWEKAVKAVSGLVISRPGQTEVSMMDAATSKRC